MHRAISLGLVVGALLCCRPTTAQGGGVTFFGTPCTTNSFTRAPDHQVLGAPRLGQSLTLRYLGGNVISACDAIGCIQRPVVVVGLSNTRFGNLRLPFSLPGLCPLRVSFEVVLPMPQVSSNGFLDMLVVSVPTDPGLVGNSVFVQWLTVDGFVLLASSRGAQITFGR